MRQAERGGALLVVMVLVLAILGGAGVLLAVQINSTRSSGEVLRTKASLYCAEAGLAVARKAVADNYALWNVSLCNPPAPRGTGACVIGSVAAEPPWLAAINHDLDGDGSPDFRLALVDNDDEVAPAANDLAVDIDRQIHIVSTCIDDPSHPVQVSELVLYDPATLTVSRKLWVRSQ